MLDRAAATPLPRPVDDVHVRAARADERSREGPGDSGAAPPTRRATAHGRPSTADLARPGTPRNPATPLPTSTAPPASPDRLCGRSPALVPRPAPPPPREGLPSQAPRPAPYRPLHPAPGSATCTGESKPGLPARARRTLRPRYQGRRLHRVEHSQRARHPARTRAGTHDPGGLLTLAGRRHPRRRLSSKPRP